jgi:hypothetical protein
MADDTGMDDLHILGASSLLTSVMEPTKTMIACTKAKASKMRPVEFQARRLVLDHVVESLLLVFSLDCSSESEDITIRLESTLNANLTANNQRLCQQRPCPWC